MTSSVDPLPKTKELHEIPDIERKRCMKDVKRRLSRKILHQMAKANYDPHYEGMVVYHGKLYYVNMMNRVVKE